jgi:molecular chaperone GrpE
MTESNPVAVDATESLEDSHSSEPVSETVADQVDPIVSLTDDLQRLQAEFSNYRKRVERDRSLASEIAISVLFTEMLSILDDLDRASEHGELTGGFKAVSEKFLATVTKFGLEKYGDTPAIFDPNIHEAMLHETSTEVSETTVTKILQPGYKFKERILRPARVVVTDPQ